MGLVLTQNITLIIVLFALSFPASAQDIRCETAGGYLMQRYAEGGDAQAQFRLSQRLDQPQCSIANQAQALDLLRRAAEQNHPEAAFLLGARYVVGLGVAEDLATGLSYLAIAADAGHLEAQFQYAMIRLESAHTDVHRDEALYWLGAAASQGDPKAALTLGHIYAGGLHGIGRHTCWASDWFDVAMLLAQDARVDVSELIPAGLNCEL